MTAAVASTTDGQTNPISRKEDRRTRRSAPGRVRHRAVEARSRRRLAEDQAKGCPVAKDSYLLIDDEELDKIQIESTHTIDIEKFVPRSEIDPRYLEAPITLRRASALRRRPSRSSETPSGELLKYRNGLLMA